MMAVKSGPYSYQKYKIFTMLPVINGPGKVGVVADAPARTALRRSSQRP